jgi:hypothetical protein
MKMLKKDLEERCKRLDREITIANQCVTDLIDGKVKWFRKANCKVGVIRPLACHGGIVIIRWKFASNDTTHHYYADEWVQTVLRDNYCPDHEEGRKEFETRNELAREVNNYIHEQQFGDRDTA